MGLDGLVDAVWIGGCVVWVVVCVFRIGLLNFI